jgi:ketosteroid isomerase-like protein
MQTKESTRALSALDKASSDNLIRTFWTERLRDSKAALTRYCAEDAVLRLVGISVRMGGPKLYKGREAIIEAIATIDLNLEFLSFSILDMIIDGNDIGLRWQASVRNRGTGIDRDFVVFDHIVLRGGEIISYTQFFDTQAFTKLISGEPAGRSIAPLNRSHPPLQVEGSPSTEPGADLPSRDDLERRLAEMWDKRVAFGNERIADYLHDDCVFHIVGDPAAIPFARSRNGKAAVLDLVRQIDIEFEFLSFEIIKIMVDGRRAAVHWKGDIRHRGTSAVGLFEAFDHVVFEGVLIKSYTEYCDTAGISRWISG